MNTTFKDLYPFFLSKLVDYQYGDLTDDEFDEIMSQYIVSARVRFRQLKDCVVDTTNKQFNRELTDLEKEILSMWLIACWMENKVFNVENFENALSSKDYQRFSEANLLGKKIETREKDITDASYWSKIYSLQQVESDLKK